MSDITEHEAAEVARANETGLQPVVFIHGLWLLPSSWDRWASVFEEAGYTPLTPGLARRPRDRRGGQRAPRGLRAARRVGQVADHFEDGHPHARPQAGRRSATRSAACSRRSSPAAAARAASVAIDPAPFRGVLPLPISALKAAARCSRNPANRNRAVPLTYEQFRYAFANAVGEEEAKELYDTYAVPGAGQAAVPGRGRQPQPVDRGEGRQPKNPERGPLLIIRGEKDHTVPWAIANASYKKQKRHNEGVTEIVEIPGRGHALTIDSGWREVADTALEFVQRFV